MTQQQYQEALDWLFVQMPNYQIDGAKAYKPGLENIARLCDFFGNPQEGLRMIHIGGTNGKGSTSNMLASVLQESGYKVGLYNSPHLVHFTERIKVNGEECSREFVYDFIQKLRQLPTDIRPSFFEFTTVMAFEYFRQQQVDFAIIEVGLGGRLDSTNIIRPILTAITNVALDHMDILGDTVEKIAEEKAGIIKNGVPIICGDENPSVQAIIREKAESMDAPFIGATTIETELQSDLTGNYQAKNIKVVVALVDGLRRQGHEITDDNLKSGLLNVHRNTGFIGRWFRFSDRPLTILDTAHNQAGLEQVFTQLTDYPQHKHIVLGFVKDKKIDEVLQLLPNSSTFYFVKPAIARGRDPHEYEQNLKDADINYQLFDTVQSGYLAAKENAGVEDLIFIGGSNFVVGEFLEKNLGVVK